MASNDSSTGWFVGVIVAIALLSIAYIVFAANSSEPVDANGFTSSDKHWVRECAKERELEACYLDLERLP